MAKYDGRKNLIPPRSTEEARQRGRKGGIKSGTSRRAKKTLRETVSMLMKSDCKLSNIIAKMEEMGIQKSYQTNQMAMVLAMFSEAMKGNVQAFNSLRDTMGEKPISKAELTGADGAPIEIAAERKELSVQEAREFMRKLDEEL